MAAPRLHFSRAIKRVESPVLDDEDIFATGGNNIKMSVPVVRHASNAQRVADSEAKDDGEQREANHGEEKVSVDSTSPLVVEDDVPQFSGKQANLIQINNQVEEPTSRKIRTSRRQGSQTKTSLSDSDDSLHTPRLQRNQNELEESLRKDLKFFFMDPVEKCRVRRRFPWKFSLQLLKIVVVTLQVILFGDVRMSHVEFIDQSLSALRHFMLSDWDDARDIRAYPPSLPPYSLYDLNDLYDHLTHSVKQYYKLNSTSFGLWMYGINGQQKPHIFFCLREFNDVQFNFTDDTYFLDTTIKTSCNNISLKDDETANNFSMRDYLIFKELPINHTKFVSASLLFNLKCIHIRRNQATNYLPDCFFMQVEITFDNSKHSGKVLIDLKKSLQYLTCSGDVLYADASTNFKIGMALVDIAVTFVCYLSMILCLRGLVRAHKLKLRTQNYFANVLNVRMTRDEELEFLNGWYIFILINDIFLIIGVVCKFSIEYKILGSALFNFTGMLLGLGVLFVWIGVLRYLGFFSHYNILILTMKRSLPNVLRFTLCAGLVYMGFLFCGWIIMGPYHMKFRDLMTASECLFALINGDDMFATFTTTSDESPSIVWFCRIYLYIFISLFIYIVLSLFISIIMDAYEIIKDKYCSASETSILRDFIADCDDASLASPGRDNSCSATTSCCKCFRTIVTKIRRLKRRRRESYSEMVFEQEEATPGPTVA